ncbi:multi protein bridging factor 1-domain-containing protein [Lipomyces doorenjongii]|uniref:multi protein bridging factor 1-domain-containing protein n=1 Tax=Lipomyces doorenjongii TaxID=383834 RepID=UPI0034CE9028
MGDQEWDSVTYIGQKANSRHSNTARSNSEINAARRSGGVVSTDKKYGAGANKALGTEGQRLAKIDRENEVAPPPKIDFSVGKAISKARAEKGLTQKDLAVKVNEKSNIINDYEMGRAVPNQQLLGKLERSLGVKLRGKDIGSPLGGPKKK